MNDQTIFFKRTVDDLPDGKPICDFCSEPDPLVLFPASAFIVSLVTDHQSYTQDYNDDGWAACGWCELLIAANDVPRLVERYFMVHPMPPDLSPRDRGFIRSLVSTQFDLFFEHRTGEPIAYPTAVTP